MVGCAGLRSDDGAFVVLRKRVGSCPIAPRATGLVRNVAKRDGYVGYELAREWQSSGTAH